MIISENCAPDITVFSALMEKTDNLLNEAADINQAYFQSRNGLLLEKDVFDALNSAAVKTPFENTIKLVSGASFPDIVAAKYYGVEVKSTKENKWKSIGSSILESTRIDSVERIFLTFGKLGAPVKFRSRPYEECLFDISVTHYPRYQIDMELTKGQTIFDKMGIPYDELRKLANPVAPVAKYYKSQLQPGERLWWADDNDVENNSAPVKVRLWSILSAEEKTYYTIKGYALFPEILGSSVTKYQNFALWLVTNSGIVNTNIRDQFSAGGNVNIRIEDREYKNLPGTYRRISLYYDEIAQTINQCSDQELCEYWGVSSIKNNRVEQWCELVANAVPHNMRDVTYDFLYHVFINYIKLFNKNETSLRNVEVKYTRDSKNGG